MKTIVRMGFVAALMVAGGVRAAEVPLPTATPESQGVKSEAIARWVEAMSEIDAVHSFVLVRHGNVIARAAWAPYDLDRPHQLYSHSKAFTSTAVGFLVDDGKLDLDAPLVSFFPDRFPANADANVLALRVRDLLTMNTGFDGSDNMKYHPEEPDWVKSFFATKPDVRPGMRFRYDTCATYVLAALVEKVAGKPMMEFLKERLCEPLGFGEMFTHVSPTGVACGGYGMYARTSDLAKFGQLFLREGDWNGTRILSRDWVRLASAKQTATGTDPTSDWAVGYGFQFWRCRPAGVYRADGSHGQCTIVMPEQDAVLSMTACVEDMGRVFRSVWDILLPAMGDEPMPSDAEAREAFEKKLAALELPPVAGDAPSVHALPSGTYTFAANARGYRAVRLSATADGVFCHLSIDGHGEQTVPVGSGVWKSGVLWTSPRNRAFEGMGDLLGEQPVEVSGAWVSPTAFKVKLLFTDQAHRLELTFAKDAVKGRHIGLGGCSLSGRAD